MTAACDSHVEASTGPGDERPRVTTALPVAAQVTEAGEYVARTEAPQSVEIRPRVAGAIVRTAFAEGELVKKGALLFVIDPRPYEVALARAKGELAGVRADRALALKNLDRAAQLRKASAIAERDFDTQTTALDQLAAREQVAQASVAAAQLELDYAYVRSPIAGRVGRKLITEGNLVGPTTASPLTTVESVNPLYVYLEVEEARGLDVHRGEPLVARVGFAGEEGYPREARIDFVDNHVDPSSGTIKLRAVVPNPDGRLAHGLFARVRLPSGSAHPALLVSDRAIATDQDRRFVWVVGTADTVEYRKVKLGPMQDGLRVVKEGLAPTDHVVVRGLQRVHPGGQVAADLVSMKDVERADAAPGAR